MSTRHVKKNREIIFHEKHLFPFLGMLPGFYMSFNHYGFAYSVNAISTPVTTTESLTRKLVNEC